MWGLDLPNIRLGGLLKSDELLRRLRADADVLFVPMSFAADDHDNMRMGFPSKLTDYTAVGLPLLIAGPADCSAVRWAERASRRRGSGDRRRRRCARTGDRSALAGDSNHRVALRTDGAARSVTGISPPRPPTQFSNPPCKQDTLVSKAAPPSFRDRALLSAVRLLPRPLVSHVMFLLNTRPAIADSWGYHVRPIHYYEPLPDFRSITADATRRRRVPVRSISISTASDDWCGGWGCLSPRNRGAWSARRI